MEKYIHLHSFPFFCWLKFALHLDGNPTDYWLCLSAIWRILLFLSSTQVSAENDSTRAVMLKPKKLSCVLENQNINWKPQERKKPYRNWWFVDSLWIPRHEWPLSYTSSHVILVMCLYKNIVATIRFSIFKWWWICHMKSMLNVLH